MPLIPGGLYVSGQAAAIQIFAEKEVE